MTAPNEPTREDTLAARELVKDQTHPAHWSDIDAGKWDEWGKMREAYEELIRRAKEGE